MDSQTTTCFQVNSRELQFLLINKSPWAYSSTPTAYKFPYQIPSNATSSNCYEKHVRNTMLYCQYYFEYKN